MSTVVDTLLDNLILEKFDYKRAGVYKYVLTYSIKNLGSLVIYFKPDGNVKDAYVGGIRWQFHLSDCFNQKNIQPTLRTTGFTSNTRFVKFSKIIKKYKVIREN